MIKTYSIRRRDSTFRVQYTVSNPSDAPIEVRFGVETVIGFDGGQDLHYCALRTGHNPERLSLNEVAALDQVSHYASDSNIRNLTLTTDLSIPATLWRFPLETIALSEAGFERGYQGTVFLQLWALHLHPGGSWSVTIAQRVTQDASRP